MATPARPSAATRDEGASRWNRVKTLLAIVEEDRERAGQSARYREALRELGDYPESDEAVRGLVDNIDEPPSPAPRFTGQPLEHYSAAQALTKCGAKARTHIFHALWQLQSQRKLHLMAYVLAKIDQEEHGPFDVEVPVLRVRKQIKWVERRRGADPQATETCMKNLRSMIEIMEAPLFSVNDFPPPGEAPQR